MKNLLIDLDDTLFDFSAAERSALSATLGGFGRVLTADEIRRYSEINLSMWKKLERGEVDRARVKSERFAIFFAEIGAEINVDAARKEYETRLAGLCPLLPGAKEFLREASARLKVYAITNGTARVQRSRLAISGLGPFFSGVFISEEVGCNKPDPRFFEAVRAALSLPDWSGTLLVGDSPTSDIAGGKAAGITTCLFDPTGKIASDADFAARSYSEIISLIGSL